MGKKKKTNTVILIFSIVLIIISLNFFIFTVNAAYDTLIISLGPTATDYFSLSNIIKSISQDELENLDIALSNLEIIRSDTNAALLSKFLNTQITPENMDNANNAYEYLTQNYDEIKSRNVPIEELSKIAENLEKTYSVGFSNLGNYIYKYNDNILEKCYFLVIAVMMNASDEYNSHRSKYAEML